MSAGIVVFGRDLNLIDVYNLTEKKSKGHPISPFLFHNLVESAHPYCLDQPEKYSYCEGILACIESDEFSEDRIKPAFHSWMVELSKHLEKDYCNFHTLGKKWAFENKVDWNCLVSHSKIADYTGGNPDYQSYFELLKTFPSINECLEDYVGIGADLIEKTRRERVKRFETLQKNIRSEALNRITSQGYRPVMI